MLQTKLKTKLALSALVLLTTAGTLILPANAYYQPYYNSSDSSTYNNGTFFQHHPYVKTALIGSGVGAVLGGVLSQEGSRTNGAVKGAILGGGAGLGIEYLKEKGFFSSSSQW